MMRGSAFSVVLSVFALHALAQEDPATLAAGAGCAACHQAEKRMMGPSWQSIADRYRGEDGALETLQERMRTGSQGVWGKPPMPPVTQKQLSDDQLSAVLAWVLNR